MTKNEKIKEKCRNHIEGIHRHKNRHKIKKNEKIPGTSPPLEFDVVCYRREVRFMAYDLFDIINPEDVNDFLETKVIPLNRNKIDIEAHMGYRIAERIALDRIKELKDGGFLISADQCVEE